jgi:ribonuclease E
MTTRMLIDARHPEETRVAVLKGNRIEEFDFESADHKQIKGNIYLAKVTRVEPSLQAAFVDFGGNRHGFLAFSEIHPDYYQIPKDDRDRLLAEEAAHAEEEAALRAAEDADDEEYEAADGENSDGENGRSEFADDYDGDGDAYDDQDGLTENDTSEKDQIDTLEGATGDDGYDEGEGEDAPTSRDEEGGEDHQHHGHRRQGRSRGRAKEADELRAKRMALRRRYKIQDVIHRRQVLLVQVVKEERGNKGAALTSYLSLAGRYCVLMPNSSHGGGISRKINSAADRKRLKSIVAEMSLPKSMGCIVRTAGLQRTKVEIKRDFDYLARLWDEIRENTLGSSAPALIHSDSDLIKRAIRDIYNKEIEDVVVEGEGGYRAARDFMKLLMPSHAKRVKAYSDPVPLFQRYGAEDQLSAMYDPFVQLKSGGYIVINPTEALVSIDINSGRSTKEYGIEATALNTNLEAAREIARQLRLRDMAGLVVIDFIDMEYSSNIRKVEKAMKDALRDDRARIQVGRISSFGLMEMSRQRLRTGVLEATTRSCPHCDGTGLVRTASSSGLSALRMIEDEAASGKGNTISLFASQEASIYVLNHKRADLAEIETLYGVHVEVVPEGENEGSKMRVASSGPRNEFVPQFGPIVLEDEDDDLPEDEDLEEVEDDGAEAQNREQDDDRPKRGKRRRGGRGRERREDRGEGDGAETSENGASQRADSVGAGSDGAGSDGADQAGDDDEHTSGGEDSPRENEVGEDGEGPRKRRRRGRRRRGGRGRGEGESEVEAEGEATDGDNQSDHGDESPADVVAKPIAEAAEIEAETIAEPAPKKRASRRKTVAVEVIEEVAEPTQAEAPDASAAELTPKPKRSRRKATEAPVEATHAEVAPTEEPGAEPAPAKPARARRKKAGSDAPSDATNDVGGDAAVPSDAQPARIAESAAAVEEDGEDGNPRRGWWQRTFGN